MSVTDPTTRRTELLATLAQEVETLRTSEGWRSWLAFASRFRSYSLNNQLLIRRQCPEATRIAGYRTWQALGRQVMRGATGIAILAPIKRSVATDDAPDEKHLVLSGFRVVFVFDVSATEGEALPEHPELPPVGVPDLGLLQRLEAVTTAAGYVLSKTEDRASGARGWYVPAAREITLVSSYPPESQVRTLLHELGHACDPLVGTAEHGGRAHRELVAESAAFIVGTSHFGLDMTDASTLYVTGWGADTTELTKLAGQVLAVAGRLEGLVADVAAAA